MEIAKDNSSLNKRTTTSVGFVTLIYDHDSLRPTNYFARTYSFKPHYQVMLHFMMPTLNDSEQYTKAIAPCNYKIEKLGKLTYGDKISAYVTTINYSNTKNKQLHIFAAKAIGMHKPQINFPIYQRAAIGYVIHEHPEYRSLPYSNYYLKDYHQWYIHFKLMEPIHNLKYDKLDWHHLKYVTDGTTNLIGIRLWKYYGYDDYNPQYIADIDLRRCTIPNMIKKYVTKKEYQDIIKILHAWKKYNR